MGKLSMLIKTVNDNFVFNGAKLVAKIPYYYMDSHLYERTLEGISTFGVFPFTVYDEKGKKMFSETMNVPTMIFMFPSEVSMDNTEGEEDEEKYIYATFFKDDILMPNGIIESLDNTEKFMNLLCAGKLPKIEYSKINNVWKKNFELNNKKTGVTSVVQEAIIRKIYRNPKKMEETFAEYLNKTENAKETDYVTANPREICARSSTFAAMTYEDLDSMITYSLNINNYKKDENISPVEEIIKM